MTATLPDGLRLGPARIAVTSLTRSLPFYEDVIGLTHLDTTDGVARLGTPDGTPVLELQEEPDARPAGRHAGLYHVALLYPTRAELAHVVERIGRSRTPIQGASDHGTHEAIYLPDPDQNGLELAVDRPKEAWPTNLGDIEEIRPRALDLDALLATTGGAPTPARAIDGLVVGHLHLHVGSIAEAADFYVDVLGFAPITRMDVALFVAAGGYHHHLGLNTWKGEGVAPAPSDALGLRHWTAFVPEPADLDALEGRLAAAGVEHRRISDGEGIALLDPWRHELHVLVEPGAR